MKLSELFVDQSKWIKGAAASDGMVVLQANDPKATCWCLSGGIEKCYPMRRDVLNRVTKYIKKLMRARGGFSASMIVFWNDCVATWDDIQKLVKELDL